MMTIEQVLFQASDLELRAAKVKTPALNERRRFC
jgi:hypothetical protein